MEALAHRGEEKKPIDPFLEELWHEYGFAGRPPFQNSSAESRLKDNCGEYTRIVLRELRSSYQPGSELSEIARKKVLSSSDTKRRELHDKIALMVAGRHRTGMENVRAEAIADFAAEYTMGVKLKDLEKFGGSTGSLVN